MIDTTAFLKKIVSIPGLSGFETPIRDLIAETWEPLSDTLSVSPIGSLHALKNGSGESPRPAVMVTTHMDTIGLMVTRIVEGFLHVTEIGGIDPRVLPGQQVVVHGRETLPGILAQPPSWLLPPGNRKGPIMLDHLLIDTGLPEKKVLETVRIGDLVSFGNVPMDLGPQMLVSHSLDNRASVAALTRCLDELQNRKHLWDLWAAATVQEEETLGGAATSAFELAPKLAIALDVTLGSGPGSPREKTFGLGSGPVLGWGSNIHPGVHKAFKMAADRLEMGTQFEVMPASSGTEARTMQVAAAGIPTMVLSIPLRYMHTPVEIIHLKDIERAGRLLAEFIAGLELDFMDTIRWEDL